MKSHRKRLITIHVDVAALASLDHRCVGCAKPEECCCARYEVCASGAEMRNIVGLMPQASRFAPLLRSGDQYDNVFDPLGGGLFSIDKTDDGLCVFAYRRDQGIRCAIHSAALELGVPVQQAKPGECLLWPLAISSGGRKVLSVCDDAYSFPCNTRRRARRRGLCSGVTEILDVLFSETCRRQIESAARKGIPRAGVLVCVPFSRDEE